MSGSQSGVRGGVGARRKLKIHPLRQESAGARPGQDRRHHQHQQGCVQGGATEAYSSQGLGAAEWGSVLLRGRGFTSVFCKS